MNAVPENANDSFFDVEEKKKQSKCDTKIFASSFFLIFNTNGSIVPEVKIEVRKNLFSLEPG